MFAFFLPAFGFFFAVCDTKTEGEGREEPRYENQNPLYFKIRFDEFLPFLITNP